MLARRRAAGDAVSPSKVRESVGAGRENQRPTRSSLGSQNVLPSAEATTSKVTRWLPWSLLFLSFLPFFKDASLKLLSTRAAERDYMGSSLRELNSSSSNIASITRDHTAAHLNSGSNVRFPVSNASNNGGAELGAAKPTNSTAGAGASTRADSDQWEEGAMTLPADQWESATVEPPNERARFAARDVSSAVSKVQRLQDEAWTLNEDEEEEEEEQTEFLGKAASVEQLTPEERAAKQRRDEQLKQRQEAVARIQKGVEAAEKRLCKPVQVKGEGWRMMCSEKAYQQIRLEKKRLQQEMDAIKQEKEMEKLTPRQLRQQEHTFKTVASSAALWKQMMNMGTGQGQGREERGPVRTSARERVDSEQQRAQPAPQHQGRQQEVLQDPKDEINAGAIAYLDREQRPPSADASHDFGTASRVDDTRGTLQLPEDQSGTTGTSSTPPHRSKPITEPSSPNRASTRVQAQVRSTTAAVGKARPGADAPHSNKKTTPATSSPKAAQSFPGSVARAAAAPSPPPLPPSPPPPSEPSRHPSVSSEWSTASTTRWSEQSTSSIFNTVGSMWGSLSQWAMTVPIPTSSEDPPRQDSFEMDQETKLGEDEDVPSEEVAMEEEELGHGPADDRPASNSEDKHASAHGASGNNTVDVPIKMHRPLRGVNRSAARKDLPFSWRKGFTPGLQQKAERERQAWGRQTPREGPGDLAGMTPDPLDDERWHIALEKAQTLSPSYDSGQSCSSLPVLEGIQADLSAADARYLGHLWRLLEGHTEEGLKYRVVLKNVTQARPVRPDAIGGEDAADGLKKVIARGRKRAHTAAGHAGEVDAQQSAPSSPHHQQLDLSDIIGNSQVDVDAIMDILDEARRRRRLLQETDLADDPLQRVKAAAAGVQSHMELAADVSQDQHKALDELREQVTEFTLYNERSDDIDPDLVLQQTPVPLTLHRMQFFPEDFWDMQSLKFCPHIYRMQKVPCKPWERRVPHVDELETELAVHGVSLSTKKDDAIRIESLATSHLAFKRELLQVLPMEDTQWRFKTCAVVGNSGVMRGSKHGARIDAHETVIRTNMAPVEGFEEDVGARTTFDFINLQHSKGFTPRVHSGGQEAESVRAPLRNSTLLVFEILSPFARNHVYAPLLRRFNSKSSNSGSRVVVLSPELVMHTHRMWFATKSAVEQASERAKFISPKYNLKPMSGFFAAVFGLQVCESVSLYGFSSYRPNRQGAAELRYTEDQLRYHYFDAVPGVTRHHSFDLAYEMYRQMSIWPCSSINMTLVP